MYDCSVKAEVFEPAIEFKAVENPRLREPPKRLRQRIVARPGPDGPSTGSTAYHLNAAGQGASCEALPGCPKPLPVSLLMSVDTGDEEPGGLPAPAVAAGPHPKAKPQSVEPQAEILKERERYVPPVVLDPKVLWSAGGKPLPPKKPGTMP
eukprot:TRINITY_DN23736_c0_g1_i4.p1 TRINITY_DN23736_c0_g1~~TRINITY_DN23736_c0_g1_i4.p1  ORF type:complete len:151 (-),score=20.69 TRINITY_DN23736_c0_g1_i4:51-503(-)